MRSHGISQLVARSGDEAHQAPRVLFTIHEAHDVMQIHVACRAKACLRKAAALRALIEADRVAPSTSKPR